MRTIARSVAIIAIIISLVLLCLFVNGWQANSSHVDLKIEGQNLSDLVRYSEYSPEGRRNATILMRNQKDLELHLLKMLRKRDGLSESFFLAVVTSIESFKLFHLLSYRGALDLHYDAISAIHLSETRNEEIIQELKILESYYKKKGYAISNDINLLLSGKLRKQ